MASKNCSSSIGLSVLGLFLALIGSETAHGLQPDKIPQLVKALDAPRWTGRQAAAEELAKIGAPAVPALLKTLQTGSLKAKRHAAFALGAIGPDAKAAIPELRALLLARENDDPEWAAEALANLGKEAIPALIAGVQDERRAVQHAALVGLSVAGTSATPALLDALKDKRWSVRWKAAQVLGQMYVKNRDMDKNQGKPAALSDTDKRIVLALSAALTDAEAPVRNHALASLGEFGKFAKPASPHLHKLIADQNFLVRGQALMLLEAIGDDFRPALLKALDSKEAMVRVFIAGFMLRKGTDSKVAMTVVREALTDKDPMVRSSAANILGELERELKDVVWMANLKIGVEVDETFKQLSYRGDAVSLQKALDSSKDVLARLHLAGYMRRMWGTGSKGFGKMEFEMMSDKNIIVRNNAAFLLGDLQRQQRDPYLLASFRTGFDLDAFQQVNGLNSTASAFAPYVSKYLEDEDAKRRQSAVGLLAYNIVGDSAVVVPALAKLLAKEKEGPGTSIRYYAAHALMHYGQRAVPVLLDLIQKNQFNDPGSVLRNEALRSLKQLKLQQDDSRQLLPALAEAMKKDVDIRKAVIGHVGQYRRQAIPLLLEALQDPDAGVRAEAARQVRAAAWIPYGFQNKKILGAFLNAACNDADLKVRKNAIYALAFLGDVGLSPLLEAVRLEGAESKIRLPILEALGRVRWSPSRAVPFLIEHVKDKDANIRATVVQSLGMYGEAAREAVPVLIAALADENADVRQTAQNTMIRFGISGEAAVILLKNENLGRAYVLNAMKKHGFDLKKAVPALIECLKDKSAEIRMLSVEVLETVGADALAALDIALDDSDPTVRTHVQAAIKRIKK